VSKPVEERVRRGVTRLPWGAEQSGGRRKEYEEIQGQAGCQDVQIPCAIHFGSEHARKPFLIERLKPAIVQHAGGVHDSTQRRHRNADTFE